MDNSQVNGINFINDDSGLLNIGIPNSKSIATYQDTHDHSIGSFKTEKHTQKQMELLIQYQDIIDMKQNQLTTVHEV